MKITAYITNNLKQKKGRTVFFLLGIIISIISASDMQLLSSYYAEITQQFFEPFEDFDQIVEKGANYFQFFPVSSRINESLESEFETVLGYEVIPALYISNDEELFNLDVTYLVGIRKSDFSQLWEDISLSSGKWPNSENECIVGYDKRDLTYIEFYDQNFTVVGVLEQEFSYLDKIMLMDLPSIQEISGNTNFVNVFYVSKEIETDTNIESNFEALYPSLDLLTQRELAEINGQVISFSDKMAQVLIFFTSLSALIFIFALNILSIHNRKKDFDIFYILGTPKHHIIFLMWLENVFLLLVGLIVSIPLSIIIYGGIYSYLAGMVKNTTNYWFQFWLGLRKLFFDFPTTKYFGTIGLITGLNLVMAAIVMFIGMRNYNLGKLKEKF